MPTTLATQSTRRCVLTREELVQVAESEGLSRTAAEAEADAILGSIEDDKPSVSWELIVRINPQYLEA